MNSQIFVSDFRRLEELQNQLTEQNDKMAEAEERRSQAQVQAEKEAKEISEKQQKELDSLQEKIKVLVRGLHHIFWGANHL